MKRQIAALLCALLLLTPTLWAQSTQTNTWPNNSSGIQNLTAGLPVSNAIWVTPSDVIFANVTSTGPGFTASFDLSARFQIAGTSGSSIQTVTQLATSITAGANAEANTILFVVPPAAGWLVMVRSGNTNGGLAFGQAWDQLMMGCGNLGLTGTGTISVATFNTCTPGPQIIGQSYTSGFENVCFGAATGSLGCAPPMGANQGFNFNATQTSPAAGVDWVYSALPNALVRACVNSITAKLVTTATVANRIPALQIGTAAGASLVYLYPSTTTAVASQTSWFSWVPGGVNASVNVTGTTFFNSVPFFNGTNGICFNIGDGQVNFQTSTAGLQVGDQWSNIIIRLTTYVENN